MKLISVQLLIIYFITVVLAEKNNTVSNNNNNNLDQANSKAVESLKALGDLLQSAFKAAAQPKNETLRLKVKLAAEKYKNAAGNSSAFYAKGFNETFQKLLTDPPSVTINHTLPTFAALEMQSESASEKEPAVVGNDDKPQTAHIKPTAKPIVVPRPTLRPIHTPYVFPYSSAQGLPYCSVNWLFSIAVVLFFYY
jgi:hypothetical protein